MRSSGRWRDDTGVAAGVEVLPFGLLVFVVGTLLVANAWAVVDAKAMTTDAAREAVRAYVEADGVDAAVAAASDAAHRAADAHGRSPDRLRVQIRPDPPHLDRCRAVVVEVTYELAALTVPLIGGYGGGHTVRSQHAEVVDPFRDGLEGFAACP